MDFILPLLKFLKLLSCSLGKASLRRNFVNLYEDRPFYILRSVPLGYDRAYWVISIYLFIYLSIYSKWKAIFISFASFKDENEKFTWFNG